MSAAPTEPRVKICGVTRPEDASCAAAAGAWAVGVVLSPGGPRSVDARDACGITAAIPDGVARVGVWVRPSIDEVRAAVAALGLTHVQVHAVATPREVAALVAAAGVPVIESVGVAGAAALDRAEASPADQVLLDAAGPGGRGGTGRRIDWDLVARRRIGRPFGLAGGLTPENVAEAVATVRPAYVDVSSGVESAPGIKDPARIEAFVRAATAIASPA